MHESHNGFHMTGEGRDFSGLRLLLRGMPEVAVAVSGGVDSMTLAFLAHRWLGKKRVTMFHAVSPAVPSQATKRVRWYANRWDWQVQIIDAGEFDDPDYTKNPVNRCYFCKKNLYSRISSVTDFQIVSGANTDDLRDYRPGLDAAKRSNVRHPFIESRIDKSQIRKISKYFGLVDLSELPSSPCLSSRVQTGIEIVPNSLRLIGEIEMRLQSFLPEARSLRCRFLEGVIELQVDPDILDSMSIGMRTEITMQIAKIAERADQKRPVRMAAYSRGSAFIHGVHND